MIDHDFASLKKWLFFVDHFWGMSTQVCTSCSWGSGNKIRGPGPADGGNHPQVAQTRTYGWFLSNKPRVYKWGIYRTSIHGDYKPTNIILGAPPCILILLKQLRFLFSIYPHQWLVEFVKCFMERNPSRPATQTDLRKQDSQGLPPKRWNWCLQQILGRFYGT